MSWKIRPAYLLLTLLLASLLCSCAGLRPDPPEVQLTGLQVSDFSLSHANFLATVSLYNPNPAALDVEGLEFTLSLADVRVASGKTAKAFTIPPEQTGTAALRLSTSFLDLFRLTKKLKGLEEIPYRVAGGIRIGGPGFLWITVPVDNEGTIPLAGALGQVFSEPRELWRDPERLLPENRPPPDTGTPAGR